MARKTIVSYLRCANYFFFFLLACFLSSILIATLPLSYLISSDWHRNRIRLSPQYRTLRICVVEVSWFGVEGEWAKTIMKKRKWISIISLPYLPTFRFKAHNSNNSKLKKKKVKCSSPIINRILQSLFWLSLFSVTFSLPNRYDPRGVNSNSSKSQKIEERSSGRIFLL